jgi:hypothetical protein
LIALYYEKIFHANEKNIYLSFDISQKRGDNEESGIQPFTKKRRNDKKDTVSW